jgi:hypothetical protein
MEPSNSQVAAQITSRYFCAGIDFLNNVVVRTAPILSYMLGWSWERVTYFCKSKGWEFKHL